MTTSMKSPPHPDFRGELNQLKIDRILLAATALFSRQGYSNCTMDEVAAHLGVTKPFLYYRFKDKADILAAICGRGVNLTHAAIVEALSLEVSASEKLRRFSEIFAATVLDNTDFVLIYKREVSNLRPEDRQAIVNIRAQTDQLVQSLLTQGQEAGEFDCLDPVITARSITGMLGFIVEWHRPRMGIPREELIHTLAELSLRMVGKRPQPANAGV